VRKRQPTATSHMHVDEALQSRMPRELHGLLSHTGGVVCVFHTQRDDDEHSPTVERALQPREQTLPAHEHSGSRLHCTSLECHVHCVERQPPGPITIAPPACTDDGRSVSMPPNSQM